MKMAAKEKEGGGLVFGRKRCGTAAWRGGEGREGVGGGLRTTLTHEICAHFTQNALFECMMSTGSRFNPQTKKRIPIFPNVQIILTL